MATSKNALEVSFAATNKAFTGFTLKRSFLPVTIIVMMVASWASLRLLSTSTQHTATRGKQQKPALFQRPLTIGLLLGPSYGTAVIGEGPRNDLWYEMKLVGPEEYLQMMKRLSSKDSRHISPPYRTIYDGIQDWPRQALRKARKNIGLPSTADVGRLAIMIRGLIAELPIESPEHNSGVILALPSLPGLYDEDACDALDYLGLFNLAGTHLMPANPRTTTLAFAAHSYGMCEDWLHQEGCSAEHLRLPFYDTLLVDYTEEALSVNLMKLRTFSTNHYHDQSPAITDFSLGSRHLSSHPEEEESYWEQIRHTVRDVIQSTLNNNVDIVMFTGESAGHPHLQEIVKQVTMEYGNDPVMHDHDALYGPARAAWSISFKAAQIQKTFPEKKYFSCPPL